jgi:hypothetical protein
VTDPLPIRVIAGSPTDEETAAIAALFSHLLLERAASTEALPGAPVRSAWERSARAIRQPWPVEHDWTRR